MSVHELRLNALKFLSRALQAGVNGQIVAAERLIAKAAQSFDDADVMGAAERRVIGQETD
jgi:hypothetical protein